jgi:hypothetical protein
MLSAEQINEIHLPPRAEQWPVREIAPRLWDAIKWAWTPESAHFSLLMIAFRGYRWQVHYSGLAEACAFF